MQQQVLEQKTPAILPQQKYLTFSETKQPSIFFNSRFDSGNMSEVVRNTFQHYSVWTASDCQGTEFASYPKSWFYFQVGGFKSRRVTFSIHRIHFLWSMLNKTHLYRPVYRLCRYGQTSNDPNIVTTWERLPHPIISLSMNNDDELVLKFDFNFQKNVQWVQFAFIYPYSYTECRQDINTLKQQYQIAKDQQVCVRVYDFCQTYQARIINLVIISSHQGKEGYQTIKYDDVMTFGGQKLIKYRSNKPIIFISARVHPIETPSSFCVQGIIQFLTNKKDMRAHLLRKYFVFVIVPMLNPDGVANGHCRMDTLNQNLNRYYKNPDPIKQPSCYSVKKLCEHYNKEKRIFMYIDLHAHPALKGNFLFGNAIFDYIQQVQSHLYPKILSQNCINFQFQQCNFSRKHMKAKDRFQDLNKEGSGRVVFYRQFGVGHSYTLQCGYHCNSYNNVISQPLKKDYEFMVKYKLNENNEKIYDSNQKVCIKKEQKEEKEQDEIKISCDKKQKCLYPNSDVFKFTQDPLEHQDSQYYKRQIVFFNIDAYKNLGKNILVSLLDIWNKNPYSRIIQISEQRKQIAEKQSKLDRFRKEQAGIKAKQKKIVELIEEQFYGNWHRRNVMMVQTTQKIDPKKSQIFIGKSSQKSRRTQKILTIQSNLKATSIKKPIGQSNFNSSLDPNVDNKVQSTFLMGTQTKNQYLNQSNIVVGATQTVLKVTDSKNIFRPINVRIRNVIISK